MNQWKRHDVGKLPRFHLSCRVSEGKHVFKVSAIELEKGIFELYMSAKSAGAPLLMKRKTRYQINIFLRELKLPSLPVVES